MRCAIREQYQRKSLLKFTLRVRYHITTPRTRKIDRRRIKRGNLLEDGTGEGEGFGERGGTIFVALAVGVPAPVPGPPGPQFSGFVGVGCATPVVELLLGETVIFFVIGGVLGR
jgi:hypothetical protein